MLVFPPKHNYIFLAMKETNPGSTLHSAITSYIRTVFVLFANHFVTSLKHHLDLILRFDNNAFEHLLDESVIEGHRVIGDGTIPDVVSSMRDLTASRLSCVARSTVCSLFAVHFKQPMIPHASRTTCFSCQSWLKLSFPHIYHTTEIIWHHFSLA